MSTIKWKMLGYTSFAGEADGYQVTLEVQGIAPYWEISEGKKVLARATAFPPTKCELTGKQQAQRVLDTLVQQKEALLKPTEVTEEPIAEISEP